MNTGSDKTPSQGSIDGTGSTSSEGSLKGHWHNKPERTSKWFVTCTDFHVIQLYYIGIIQHICIYICRMSVNVSSSVSAEADMSQHGSLMKSLSVNSPLPHGSEEPYNNGLLMNALIEHFSRL